SVLQKAGRQEGGDFAQTGRLLRHQGPDNGRQSGLYSAPRCCRRQGQIRRQRNQVNPTAREGFPSRVWLEPVMPSPPFAFTASPQAITHAPASLEYFVDRCFRALAIAAAALLIVLVAYILWKIGGQAMPAIHKYHFNFLISSQYNVQE